MLKHGIPSEDVASCSVHFNTNDTLDLTTPKSLSFTAPEPESYQQQNDSEIASPLTDGDISANCLLLGESQIVPELK